jgi:hypothetical protein
MAAWRYFKQNKKTNPWIKVIVCLIIRYLKSLGSLKIN